MNVTKPEKVGLSKKGIIIYSTIIFVCIIALIVGFYVQFYKRIDIGRLVGINQEQKYGNKTEEEIEEIKANFLSIFDNNFKNMEGSNNEKKEDESKELVYASYEKKEVQNNNFDLEVHIPYINVQGDVIKQYNSEIKDVFIDMVDKILKTSNRNIIYTVDYTANVQNGILSISIYSNYKEGANAQKVIIKTYNYDLRNNKELALNEVFEFEQLDKQKIQNQINTEIELQQQKVKDLEKIGYKIFKRDVSNDMYNIENTKEFYMTEDIVYIIYPYGNNANTSEIDLVIL